MKKLTTILIAFSLSLLFSIRAFAIDDIVSYLRIADWKSYEAKGGVYKNAFNKSSYRFTSKLSDTDIKETDRIINKFIAEHTDCPNYVIVYDEYHSPNEIRIYYSEQPFIYFFSDYYGVLMAKVETTIHYYNYEVGKGREFYLDDINLKPTQYDIDNYHGWADKVIGHYALDSSVPTYLVDELYAIENGADVETYTVGSDKNHIYNYDDFDFLTDLRFKKPVQENASNHLFLPSIDCDFVYTKNLPSFSLNNTVTKNIALLASYGIDKYQDSFNNEFFMNVHIYDDVSLSGSGLEFQNTLNKDGYILFDIPYEYNSFYYSWEYKFGYPVYLPCTRGDVSSFNLYVDIWLTDIEGNESQHFIKKYVVDGKEVIKQEILDNGITSNDNPFDDSELNGVINSPNVNKPLEDSPSYNVSSQSGVNINNNNNVNFPSDINVHVDGVGGSGGNDIDFNFGEIGDNVPSDIKDGLGWFDPNNGYLSFLTAFVGNIDPRLKNIIVFSVIATVTIALIRLVLKR